MYFFERGDQGSRKAVLQMLVAIGHKQKLAKGHMIFFGDGHILNAPGLDDVLTRKFGGFVIGHAHKVHGRFGELHFYIVVTAALKIYLPGNVLVICIVAKVWQVHGDLYFGKIF